MFGGWKNNILQKWHISFCCNFVAKHLVASTSCVKAWNTTKQIWQEETKLLTVCMQVQCHPHQSNVLLWAPAVLFFAGRRRVRCRKDLYLYSLESDRGAAESTTSFEYRYENGLEREGASSSITSWWEWCQEPPPF